MKPSTARPGPRYPSSLLLIRRSEALWNASRVFLSRWDLSPSQFNILNLLYGEPAGCTQIELSRQLITHRSNITGLLDRLAGRGLVERRNTLNDRRAFNVVLTPSGQELVRRIQPEYFRALEQIWGARSVEEARSLVSDLSSVVENAENLARAGHRNPNKQTGGSYARDD